MKKLFSILFLVAASASANPFTPNPTTRMGLGIPIVSTSNFSYPTTIAATFQTIDSSAAVLASSNTFISTNTFTQDVVLQYGTGSQCLALDSSKNIVSQACGGGGVSSLATAVGTRSGFTTLISSPTAGIVFSSTSFSGVLAGASTAYIDLNAGATYFIHNTSSQQTGAVLNVSSGTVSTLNATTVKFLDGTSLTTAVSTATFIISTTTLQSGTTIYPSSGTINSFTTSTATVNNLLVVNGTGQTGSAIVAQVAGSTFNVTANGKVGIGTAAPGFALDVRGDISASTVTVTSGTVTTLNTGTLVFGDGSSQISAATNNLGSTQTWTGQNNWSTPAPSTFTYGVSVGSFTGAGLSTCGDSTHGLAWSATTKTFSCQSITGSAVPGGSSRQIQYNLASSFAGLPSFVTASSVTISTPTAILGSIAGANTLAGYVGEIVESTNTSSNASTFNLATITLTAGNWLVFAHVQSTAGISTVRAGISLNSASFTGTVTGYSDNTGGGDAGGNGMTSAIRNISVASNTTTYLVVLTSPGNRTVDGSIMARRMP